MSDINKIAKEIHKIPDEINELKEWQDFLPIAKYIQDKIDEAKKEKESEMNKKGLWDTDKVKGLIKEAEKRVANLALRELENIEDEWVSDLDIAGAILRAENLFIRIDKGKE